MRKVVPALLCALALAGCDGGEEERGGSASDAAGAAGGSGRAESGSGRTAQPAEVSPTGDGCVEASEIRAPGLREHLRALQEIADENGGNRAAGTPGSEASAEYVADRLREDGWRVELDPVTFPYFDERSPPRLDDLEEGSEFRTLSYSGSGSVEARVRRLGLGCDRRDFRAAETAAGRPDGVVMAGGHLDSVPARAGDRRQRKRDGCAPGDRGRPGRPGARRPGETCVLGSGGAGADRVAPVRAGAGAGGARGDDIDNVDMPILVEMARAAGESVERLSARG